MRPVLGTQRFFAMQRAHFLCQEQKSLELPPDDEDLDLEKERESVELARKIDAYENRMERE